MCEKKENLIEVDFQISERFANIAMDLLNDGWSSSELYDIGKNCEALPDDIGKEEYISIQKFMQVLENMRYLEHHPEKAQEKNPPKDKPIINQYARWIRNQSMEKEISMDESIILLPFYDHNSDPLEVFVSKEKKWTANINPDMQAEEFNVVDFVSELVYTLDDAGETIGNLLLNDEETRIYLPKIRHIVEMNGAELVDDSIIRFSNISEKDFYSYLHRIYSIMLLVDGLSYEMEGKE